MVLVSLLLFFFVIATYCFNKGCAELNDVRVEAISRCLYLKCIIAYASFEDLLTLDEEIREFHSTYQSLIDTELFHQTTGELADAVRRRMYEVNAAA
jgi:hypothetical protein